jgi:hypothetical protein
MQHYGAPTRLLDFTRSFWIALFFAVEEADNECAVVALRRSSLAKNHKEGNLCLRQNIDDGKYIDDYLRADVEFFMNERLAIQQGIFVYSMNLTRRFHDLLPQSQEDFQKLTVPRKLFPGIRRMLNEFNCSSLTLFPGLDGYGRYFKNPPF